MRPGIATTRWRRSRPRAAALILAGPSCAAALLAGQAFAAPAQQSLKLVPRSLRVSYGRAVVLRGSTSAADAGHTVLLEFARRGQSAWRSLSSSTVASDGTFRLAAVLGQSGALRAVDTASGAVTPLVARVRSGGSAPTSTPVPVEVAARVRVRSRQIAVLGGQAIQVRGRLLPGLPHRRVSLQAHQGGGWRTLTSTRTGATGRFVLRFVVGSAGQESIRVRFGGDRLNGRSVAGVGQMTVFRQSEASWYVDAGNTACGFHAHYGVANRTLPCGTKVTFRLGGRSVTATVDDRGPFVGGRDWDLNQNTASALGFGGVGAVWSSQ